MNDQVRRRSRVLQDAEEILFPLYLKTDEQLQQYAMHKADYEAELNIGPANYAAMAKTILAELRKDARCRLSSTFGQCPKIDDFDLDEIPIFKSMEIFKGPLKHLCCFLREVASPQLAGWLSRDLGAESDRNIDACRAHFNREVAKRIEAEVGGDCALHETAIPDFRYGAADVMNSAERGADWPSYCREMRRAQGKLRTLTFTHHQAALAKAFERLLTVVESIESRGGVKVRAAARDALLFRKPATSVAEQIRAVRDFYTHPDALRAAADLLVERAMEGSIGTYIRNGIHWSRAYEEIYERDPGKRYPALALGSFQISLDSLYEAVSGSEKASLTKAVKAAENCVVLALDSMARDIGGTLGIDIGRFECPPDTLENFAECFELVLEDDFNQEVLTAWREKKILSDTTESKYRKPADQGRAGCSRGAARL